MVFGVQKVIALITQVPDTGLMTIAEHVAIFDSLVGEITQHYQRGRVLIAIDGADEQGTRGFADSMAVAMKARSWQVVRSTSTPRAAADRDDLTFPRHDGYRSNEDFSRLREIVTHFRDGSLAADTSGSGVFADAVLIVDGRFLLRPELRGIWHFGVWLEGDHQLSDESLELGQVIAGERTVHVHGWVEQGQSLDGPPNARQAFCKRRHRSRRRAPPPTPDRSQRSPSPAALHRPGWELPCAPRPCAHPSQRGSATPPPRT